MTAFPEQAELYLTDRCNLRCRYCYVAPEDHGAELSSAEWRGVIGQLAELQLRQLLFSGGEPLLLPEFPTLVQCAAEAGMRFSVTTNGALLTCRMIEKLLPFKNECDFFQISLDGTAEIHDAARGKGAFEGAARAVRLLQEAGFPLQAKMTLGVHNQGRLAEAARAIFEDLSIPFCATNLVSGMRGKKVDMQLKADEFPALMAEYAQLLERYPNRFLAEGPWMVWRYCRDIWRNRTSVARHVGCAAANRRLAIMADGTVRRCAAVFDDIQGNCRTESLSEIWRRSLENPLGVNRECATCPHRNFCAGKCPGTDILCLKKIIGDGGNFDGF